MADETADLIGPDEVAFTLELTPPQLKILHSALRSMRDDFGISNTVSLFIFKYLQIFS
jgi:hypothetical protein